MRARESIGGQLVEKRLQRAPHERATVAGVNARAVILGLDPLYVANEGKLIAFVTPGDAEKVLGAMQNHPLGREAVIIGEVVADHAGTVLMKSSIGGTRVVDMLSGEQLPRIC